MVKVYIVCTCREGRELSHHEFQCISHPLVLCMYCQFRHQYLEELEGCSGGYSSSLVLTSAECDFQFSMVFSVTYVSVLLPLLTDGELFFPPFAFRSHDHDGITLI